MDERSDRGSDGGQRWAEAARNPQERLGEKMCVIVRENTRAAGAQMGFYSGGPTRVGMELAVRN